MSTTSNRSGITTGADDASLAVAAAVSEASGTPVLELPPLNDALDPDALNDLFDSDGAMGLIEFRYAGYLVTVTSDGTVELSE